MIGKSMARGQDQSTPSAGAEAEGRSVGTRSWLILSECHWLTIIGELRSLWFIIILIIAPGQNVIFVLHIFLCPNILRQSATWRITIELLKSSTNHFNPKIEAKTPWDKGTELSHWIRSHFDSAGDLRQQDLKALELAENRRKDETIGKLIDHILKKDN